MRASIATGIATFAAKNPRDGHPAAIGFDLAIQESATPMIAQIAHAQATQAPLPIPPISRPLIRRAGAMLFLVALADWLFYKHELGISIAIFLAVLCVAVTLNNRLRTSFREFARYAAIFVVAFFPVIEDASLISFFIVAAGAAIFALGVSGNLQGRGGEKFRSVAKTLLIGPFRLPFDLFHFTMSWEGLGDTTIAIKKLAVWVVPLGLGMVFLLLFASANPLIPLWLSKFDFSFLQISVNPFRIAFWGVIAFAVWPFLYIKSARVTARVASAQTPSMPEGDSSPLLFGPAAILRSLALFNILFAAQSGLDITYLWAGVALPSGLTYASYAHQGAYPLIVTALLAAAFVLAALRRGSEANEVRTIKVLIVLWIAQNILLVTSSILRLDLYVATYSLTWLRFAAFVWMLLVAAGLVLILVRIALKRPNRWLIGANCCTLGFALYVTSLINVPALIARYNVDHCRQISGQGVELDIYYLASLGPQALPAIDRYFVLHPAGPPRWQRPGWVMPHQWWLDLRATWANDLLMREWRGWGFREERLRRYLARRQLLLGPAEQTGHS